MVERSGSVTHQPLLALQYVTENVGDHSVGVYCKLGLRVNSWQWSHGYDKTHVEDVEDPGQVQLPGDKRIFIIIRMEESIGWISPALLDDIPLDLRQSSETKIDLGDSPEYPYLV